MKSEKKTHFMHTQVHTKNETIRVNGKLKEMLTIHDSQGNVISKIISPLMLEFHVRDFFQVIVGSVVLAFPMSLSDEVWTITQSLPLSNILIFAICSLVFIGLFVFYNFYRGSIKNHVGDYIKRIALTYTLTLLVSAFFLGILQKAPWGVDNMLALKRVLLIAFPAAFSATIADSIK